MDLSKHESYFDMFTEKKILSSVMIEVYEMLTTKNAYI